MKKNDVFCCVDEFGYDNPVLNCEALMFVLNSDDNVIPIWEKRYFINLFCRTYHLKSVEKSFNTEIETGELSSMFYEMDKLISKSKLCYYDKYDKWMIFDAINEEYLSLGNTMVDLYEDCLINTVFDIKTYSSKEEAEEAIKKLNLNKNCLAKNINMLTEIDGKKFNSNFETFDYLALIDNIDFPNSVEETNIVNL